MKLHISLYLCEKFQVYSIILTSFRQGRGVITPPPTHIHTRTSKHTPKEPTQIKIKKFTSVVILVIFI